MSSDGPSGRDARGFQVAVLASLLLACSSPALAAKTDVVVLKNGDRLTGEVKGIGRARLELSTDSIGTIYIEIEDISEVTARGYFEVENTAGQRYYGTLRPAGPGQLGVMLGDKTEAIDLLSVVRLRPIGQTFLRRFDGSIDLGASYTQSSGIGQGTLSASLVFRRPSFEASSYFDSTITAQATEPTTSRYQLQLGYTQLLRSRWMIPGIVSFESNSDLGLKLRSSIGGGVGRIVAQTFRQSLVLAGGIAVNQEIPLEGDTIANLEVFVAMTHSYVTYDRPKTDLSTRLFVYPSLSDLGRWRLALDTKIKRELIKDFNVGLSVYDTYDSRPPDTEATKNDIGISITIGWSF